MERGSRAAWRLFCEDKRRRFLASLLQSFHKARRKTLALAIAAIAAAGETRSFVIATSCRTGCGPGSTVPSTASIDCCAMDTSTTSNWPRDGSTLPRRPDRKILLAVDWTEWHHDLRLPVAAMVTGKRVIPVFTQGWTKMVSRRSQNTRESTFLRQLAEIIHRVGVTATVLCDRGFRCRLMGIARPSPPLSTGTSDTQ